MSSELSSKRFEQLFIRQIERVSTSMDSHNTTAASLYIQQQMSQELPILGWLTPDIVNPLLQSIRKTRVKFLPVQKKDMADLMAEAVDCLLDHEQWRHQSLVEIFPQEAPQSSGLRGSFLPAVEKGSFIYKLMQPNITPATDLTDIQTQEAIIKEFSGHMIEKDVYSGQQQLIKLRQTQRLKEKCMDCQQVKENLIKLNCGHTYCLDCQAYSYISNMKQLLRSIQVSEEFNLTYCPVCRVIVRTLDKAGFDRLFSEIKQQKIPLLQEADNDIIENWKILSGKVEQKKQSQQTKCPFHPDQKISKICFDCKHKMFLCPKCMTRHQKSENNHKTWTLSQGAIIINSKIQQCQHAEKDLRKAYTQAIEIENQKQKMLIDSKSRLSQAIDMHFDSICRCLQEALNEIKAYHFNSSDDSIKKVSHGLKHLYFSSTILRGSVEKLRCLKVGSTVLQMTQVLRNISAYKKKWGKQVEIHEDIADEEAMGDILVEDSKKLTEAIEMQLDNFAEAVYQLEHRLNNLKSNRTARKR